MRTISVISDLLCKKIREIGMNDRQGCVLLFLGEPEVPEEIVQARVKRLK